MLHPYVMMVEYLRTGVYPPVPKPERWANTLLLACKLVADGDPNALVPLPAGVRVADTQQTTAEAWLLVGVFGLERTALIEPGVLSDDDVSDDGAQESE